jgi:hypothetical protein
MSMTWIITIIVSVIGMAVEHKVRDNDKHKPLVVTAWVYFLFFCAAYLGWFGAL